LFLLYTAALKLSIDSHILWEKLRFLHNFYRKAQFSRGHFLVFLHGLLFRSPPERVIISHNQLCRCIRHHHFGILFRPKPSARAAMQGSWRGGSYRKFGGCFPPAGTRTKAVL